MGLSQEYYADLIKKSQQKSQVKTTPVPIVPTVTKTNIAGSTPAISPMGSTGNIFKNAQEEAVGGALKFSELSKEDQVKRFGSEVGSAEYYQNKSEHPYTSFLPKQILGSLGVVLPKDEEWDTMTRADQISYLGTMGTIATAKIVTSVPQEIVKTPIRLAMSAYRSWQNAVSGKPLAEEEALSVPILGEVPTYWKSQEDALKSGAGPLAAGLITMSNVAGDVSIVGSLGEAVTKAFQPRKAISETEPIKNIEPVKTALVEEQGKLKAITKKESTSEYYSVPKTVAKESGGSSKNTFIKITPAGEDAVEVSLVQTRNGIIPKTIDRITGKETYAGDFGPEVKIQSQIIKQTKKQQTILEGEVTELPGESAQKVISSIPEKPLRGFENKAITSEQISNLETISKVNGIDSGTKDAIVRTITGKKVVGELSQAEYTKTAQTLALFNEMGKYSPEISGSSPLLGRYGSPQRYWMRTLEEKTGIKLYSEGYVPIEDAKRIGDVFRDSYRNKSREIFGKYGGPKFAEERRLLKNYMEGNTEAIVGNKTISQEVKNDLIKIANDMRPIYDKTRVIFGIEGEIKNYQPHIKNIGGVYQLYKEGQPVPKSIDFFAKFKREGSIDVQVDDALALFDIYINAGSNSLFLNPALERVASFGQSIPKTIQNSLKSYVQEKLGYAGPVEEWLNNLGSSINKNLNTNLPDDVVRQMTQIYMDTTYAGGMGLSLGTIFRNSLQYDVLTYPRLGPTFYIEAAERALTKEGLKEVRDAGFLVGTGEPYGQALTQEVNIGGKIVNYYRKGAQATLKPFSMVESSNRARTYWQTKLQFNDAVSKYNSGKLNWNGLEKELDFNSLSPIDRNIVRQRIISGDVKGAFENIVRDVLDETQFPYRKAASSRVTYGLTGRLGTQFAQWNIEFAHTMGNWIKDAAQGSPQKLMRFAASSYTIQRSLENSLGFDFTRSVGLGPFNTNFSPTIKTGIDIVNTMNAWKQGNAESLNENADSIVKSMKSLGVPAGVQIQRWNNFLKSYQKGAIGPNGTYAVLDSRGKVNYWTDFSDIFWQMWGFPTTQKEQFLKQSQELRSASLDYSQTKQKVLELYQQEKYDEANELISENGIKIGPSDFDAYYIPYTDRAFKALPASLKGQFAPKIYK